MTARAILLWVVTSVFLVGAGLPEAAAAAAGGARSDLLQARRSKAKAKAKKKRRVVRGPRPRPGTLGGSSTWLGPSTSNH